MTKYSKLKINKKFFKKGEIRCVSIPFLKTKEIGNIYIDNRDGKTRYCYRIINQGYGFYFNSNGDEIRVEITDSNQIKITNRLGEEVDIDELDKSDIKFISNSYKNFDFEEEYMKLYGETSDSEFTKGGYLSNSNPNHRKLMGFIEQGGLNAIVDIDFIALIRKALKPLFFKNRNVAKIMADFISTSHNGLLYVVDNLVSSHYFSFNNPIPDVKNILTIESHGIKYNVGIKGNKMCVEIGFKKKSIFIIGNIDLCTPDNIIVNKGNMTFYQGIILSFIYLEFRKVCINSIEYKVRKRKR